MTLVKKSRGRALSAHTRAAPVCHLYSKGGQQAQAECCFHLHHLVENLHREGYSRTGSPWLWDDSVGRAPCISLCTQLWPVNYECVVKPA